MSGYSIEKFTSDFANRTWINYKKIKNGPFEVTQMINSLFGLLIVPEEKFKYKSLTHAEKQTIGDSPDIQKIIALIDDCRNDHRYKSTYPNEQGEGITDFDMVANLCRHMRNSIAHGGYEGLHFYPLEDSDIKNILFMIVILILKQTGFLERKQE